MSDVPAMPLFCEPLLADTDHLTDCELGLYMRMIAKLWLAPNRRFPNDDEWLARKFRKTPDQVRSDLRPLIQEFFKTDGNRIYHKRIDKEYEHIMKTQSARSASAKARWDKEKRECKRYAPTPTLTPTLIEEESIPPTESVTPSEPELLAGKPASRYAWEGQVIRLTARDLKSWRAVGRDLDLEAYLFKRDLWLASLPADDARRKKWFVGTGTDLANSQQRAAAEKAMLTQARGKIDNRHEEANRRRIAEERATDAGLSPYSPEWMQFASQAMKGGLANGQQHRAA